MSPAGLTLEETLSQLAAQGKKRVRVVDISTQRGMGWPGLRVLRMQDGPIPELTVCRFPEIQ